MLTRNDQSLWAAIGHAMGDTAAKIDDSLVLQREYFLTLADLHYAQATADRLFDL